MGTAHAADGRRLIHVRKIECEVFERQDGLLELEAILVDTKPVKFQLPERGEIAPGDPVHEMSLCVAIDRSMFIHQVTARTIHSPYAVCGMINKKYDQLVGLRIGVGFGHAVKRLFLGISGCTHLTELVSVIAATAFQGVWGDPEKPVDVTFLPDGKHDSSPFDGCHALRRDGEIIERYFSGEIGGKAGVKLHLTDCD